MSLNTTISFGSVKEKSCPICASSNISTSALGVVLSAPRTKCRRLDTQQHHDEDRTQIFCRVLRASANNETAIAELHARGFQVNTAHAVHSFAVVILESLAAANATTESRRLLALIGYLAKQPSTEAAMAEGWSRFGSLIESARNTNVWANLSVSCLAFLVERIFAPTNENMVDVYLPHGSLVADWGGRSLEMLAAHCRVFASKGQVLRYLVHRSFIREEKTQEDEDDVLRGALNGWQWMKDVHLTAQCNFDVHDLLRVARMGSLEVARKRLGILTAFVRHPIDLTEFYRSDLQQPNNRRCNRRCSRHHFLPDRGRLYGILPSLQCHVWVSLSWTGMPPIVSPIEWPSEQTRLVEHATARADEHCQIQRAIAQSFSTAPRVILSLVADYLVLHLVDIVHFHPSIPVSVRNSCHAQWAAASRLAARSFQW